MKHPGKPAGKSCFCSELLAGSELAGQNLGHLIKVYRINAYPCRVTSVIGKKI